MQTSFARNVLLQSDAARREVHAWKWEASVGWISPAGNLRAVNLVEMLSLQPQDRDTLGWSPV